MTREGRRAGLIILVLANLASSCGETKTPAESSMRSTSAKALTSAAVATRSGFVRCLHAASVPFRADGGVPGDPHRTNHPLGWNGATSFSGAEYIGAASFRKGGFIDVWLTDTPARAADLSASFEDPALAPDEAKDWYFDHERNFLMGTFVTGTSELDDMSAAAFDRCLRESA
jgi:hypothetical protein